MTPASAKSKGRELQKWVRDRIRKIWPRLTLDDVASRAMGQGGTDIVLSAAAQRKFPFSVECKHWGTGTKKFFDVLAQAQANSTPNMKWPLGVVKMRGRQRENYMVLMYAEDFFTLLEELRDARKPSRKPRTLQRRG